MGGGSSRHAAISREDAISAVSRAFEGFCFCPRCDSNLIEKSSAHAWFCDGEAHKGGRNFEADSCARRFQCPRVGTCDFDYCAACVEQNTPSPTIKTLLGAVNRMVNGSDRGFKLSGSFQNGDCVEARFQGSGGWYKGTVARVNRDGTFDVEYDDSDKEQSALAANIRLPEEAEGRPKKYDGRSCGGCGGGGGGGDHARSRDDDDDDDDDDCDDRRIDSRACGGDGEAAKPKVCELGDDQHSDDRTRGGGGQDTTPKVRELTEVVYTATGPKAVSCDAPHFPVVVWLLSHSAGLVAALEQEGAGYSQATHDEEREWLQCSVEVENCVAELTRGDAFGQKAAATPLFQWDGKTPANASFTVWVQPANCALTLRGVASVEVLRRKKRGTRGRGRKAADSDSDSPDPRSRQRGGQQPNESELEVVTTHFVQVEIARRSAGSFEASSPSQDCLLGHLKAMEGRLTANMLRAADLVVCSMQRQIPTACVIIPEVLLHPPPAGSAAGPSPSKPLAGLCEFALNPSAFVGKAARDKLCTKYSLFMICEGCGKHHPNAKAFEIEVVEGSKCEALERCLPAAKATLQIAALANMAVNLASIFFPALSSADASKGLKEANSFLSELRQGKNAMEDFEAVHKAISNEKDKEKEASRKGRRSPTEVAVGVEAAAGGSEVGRLPYEEFVTYLMGKVDEKHLILMQTGLTKRISGR